MAHWLITGATGLIGSALIPTLLAAGNQITVVSRRPQVAARLGDHIRVVEAAADCAAGAEVVVHLAGASVAGGPWTQGRRETLIRSRTDGSAALGAWAARSSTAPRVWITASAIGYYGDSTGGDGWLTEGDPQGVGFASELCAAAEAAGARAAPKGTRHAALRIGLVLAANGGYLEPQRRAIDWYAGSVVGDGRQWQSWVHLADVVAAIEHVAATDELSGPVNLTAPAPARLTELLREVADRRRRPLPWRIPAGALRFALGEFADRLLLASQRVEPAALLGTGFLFRYPTLPEALNELLPGATSTD